MNLPKLIQAHGYGLELERPWAYTAYWDTLAPSANPTPQNINLLADQDFYWVGCTWATDLAGADVEDSTIHIPLVAVQFTLAGSPFQDSELPITMIANGPNRPFKALVTPMWLPAGGTLTINARNYSAATDYNLWLSLIGVKFKRIGLDELAAKGAQG